MENIDKSSGINVILSLFTGVTDKSDNEKKEKELSKQFGQLAERLLYGGYFSINNKIRIYLEEIEFYYHEEEGSLKDPAMYHTNAHQGQSLEYFVPGSLNCHVSGIDVTFENEEKKYRASFLIRGYRVERFNDGEWKVKEGKAFEKRSTYIYQDMIDNMPLDGDGIHVKWINETMPEKHDVVSGWRRNIPAQEYYRYDDIKHRYQKKGEEHIGKPEEDYFKNGKFWYKKCNRMWNFKKAN